MEVFILGWWWRGHQSLETQRFTDFQILYYALERWTRTHNQIMHGEDRLTWFKSSSEYGALDKIDGEPMEFEWNIFPGFTTLQRVREVQELLSRLSVQPENSTGRIIFVSMFNDISWGSKDNEKGMRIKRSARFSLCEKIFTRTIVIPRTWIRKEMVFYSRIQTTRRMGQSCRANHEKIEENRQPSIPIHESIIQRNAQEQRWWKIVNTLLCRWWDGWKCVFVQLFLLVSSVFKGQSQICVKNVKLAKSEQGDLLWQDNLTHCLCHVMKTHIPLTDDPAQEEDLLQRYQERPWQVITTRSSDWILYWCRIPDHS